MKTVITKNFVLGSVALLMLQACKKDGVLVYSNGGKPGTLGASATTLPLDRTKLNDGTPVITFTVTKADYGFKAAVTNTLQIDAASDNWAKPTTVTLSTNVLSQGYSTADFNAMLLKLNLVGGVSAQVQARVMQSVSTAVTPIYSNVVNLTVTPFNLTSYLYVPGAYEGSSWPNPGPLEDSLVSATGNGVYIGIINFTAGNNQFLVTPKKNWDHKYATNDPSNTTGTFNVTYDGSNNFFAPPTAGWYLITLDLNLNKITIVPADYYSLIGSTTPGSAWSTDTPLKFINDGNNTWSASGVAMTEGIAPSNGFKIRQDDAWSWSWGTLPTPDGATLTNASGGNISITAAGNYNVSFIMAPTAFGTKPAVTTGYTLVKQ